MTILMMSKTGLDKTGISDNHIKEYWEKKGKALRKKTAIILFTGIFVFLTLQIPKIISNETIQEILLQSIGGFIFWTTSLTPYMLFVVKTRGKQYWKWVAMQATIIPFLSPLSIWMINQFVALVKQL